MISVVEYVNRRISKRGLEMTGEPLLTDVHVVDRMKLRNLAIFIIEISYEKMLSFSLFYFTLS